MMLDASFWAAAAFMLLGALLTKNLKRKVFFYLDQRSKKIADDISEATRLHQEAEVYLKKAQDNYEKSQQEVADILLHAQQEAERLQEQALKRLKEMEGIEEERLKERVAVLEKQAIQEIEQKAVDIALAATSHLISRTHTADREKDLFDRTLQEIKSLSLRISPSGNESDITGQSLK